MTLTLNKLLWAAALLMAVVFAGIYRELDQGTERVARETASRLRASAISRVSQSVQDYLVQGERPLGVLRAQLLDGNCQGPATEACLLAELLANAGLTELTFTEGEDLGFDEDGDVKLAPAGRRQVSVFRASPSTNAQVCTREVTGEGERFTARVWCRSPWQALGVATAAQTEPASDPTHNDGFTTPASRGRRNRILRSDLSWSTLDEKLPPEKRRVVLLGLLAVEDSNQRLIGVLKAGLLEQQLRTLMKTERVTNLADDPFHLFIADDTAKLVTGLSPEDRLEEFGDDLRIRPQGLLPEVAAALERPELKAEAGEDTQATFTLAGRPYSVTFHPLQRTYGWRLGVVGPDDVFVKDLEATRRQLLTTVLVALLAILLGGVLVLRVIGRTFAQIQGETRAMHAFHFEPTPVRSAFADVRDTLFSLEQAKTAVRAMGKYVPLALVHGLFSENREPMLGGAPREVTLLFSDIEGFTARAEAEPPDAVAHWLGRYLSVMAGAVQAENGTVDKFIGDAVMAMWNAPRLSPAHTVDACRAALRCLRETDALYTSPEWQGRPPLVTRIGLHVGSVMLGHFGAPDRLSYTAIGDSVNLASRLEGLNKLYGTRILVSEDVYARAKEAFGFRLIDRVAVKGKSNAIAVYELLGEKGDEQVGAAVCAAYAEGLAHYAAGNFPAAQAAFERHPSDAPSGAMAARCAELCRTPPAQPWTGVLVATSK